MSDYKIGHIS